MKYRIKQIHHVDSKYDYYIIQKRILGLFWWDCDEYGNVCGYFVQRYFTLEAAEHAIKNCLGQEVISSKIYEV